MRIGFIKACSEDKWVLAYSTLYDLIMVSVNDLYEKHDIKIGYDDGSIFKSVGDVLKTIKNGDNQLPDGLLKKITQASRLHSFYMNKNQAHREFVHLCGRLYSNIYSEFRSVLSDAFSGTATK